MPAAMQAKLLRVLQEGEITPVGDSRPRTVDVRVISATNRDLEAETAGRRFREDLFFRLAAFPIRVPPLRERREDIPPLAEHLLARAAERHGKRISGIEPAAMECLAHHDWPGNVRELQNHLERAVALARDGDPIAVALFAPRLRGLAGGSWPAGAGEADASRDPRRAAGSLRQARAEFEARYIAGVLREHGANVSRAARALGLSRVMLQKKMKEYGLRSAARGRPTDTAPSS